MKLGVGRVRYDRYDIYYDGAAGGGNKRREGLRYVGIQGKAGRQGIVMCFKYELTTYTTLSTAILCPAL